MSSALILFTLKRFLIKSSATENKSNAARVQMLPTFKTSRLFLWLDSAGLGYTHAPKKKSKSEKEPPPKIILEHDIEFCHYRTNYYLNVCVRLVDLGGGQLVRYDIA